MTEVTTGIGNIPGFLIAAIATFVVCLIAEPILQWLMRFFGVYAIVEEGTPAAKQADQISDKAKEDRKTELTNAYYDVAHAKAQKRIGQTETIILEETEGDTVLGRTRREAPEIDAIVRLPQSATRNGRFVAAKLTGYDAYEFTAIPA